MKSISQHPEKSLMTNAAFRISFVLLTKRFGTSNRAVMRRSHDKQTWLLTSDYHCLNLKAISSNERYLYKLLLKRLLTSNVSPNDDMWIIILTRHEINKMPIIRFVTCAYWANEKDISALFFIQNRYLRVGRLICVKLILHSQSTSFVKQFEFPTIRHRRIFKLQH